MSKFNCVTGFHIRVNLFIICFLFCHMDCKSDPNLNGVIKKRRPKYLIYESSYFPSRQRMDRIYKGIGFDFSNMEAEEISNTFAIDKSFFTKQTAKPFPIKGVTDMDWLCFYKKKYNVDDERLNELSEKEISTSHNRILVALRRIVRSWEKLSHKDPLYRICFYYYYDTIFMEKVNPKDTLRDLLKSISYADWEKESIEYLEDTYKLLRNHTDYLSCKLDMYRLQKEEAMKK